LLLVLLLPPPMLLLALAPIVMWEPWPGGATRLAASQLVGPRSIAGLNRRWNGDVLQVILPMTLQLVFF
jgi:hypothetical protein